MSITPPVESLNSCPRDLLTISGASMSSKSSNTGTAVLNSGQK